MRYCPFIIVQTLIIILAPLMNEDRCNFPISLLACIMSKNVCNRLLVSSKIDKGMLANNIKSPMSNVARHL